MLTKQFLVCFVASVCVASIAMGQTKESSNNPNTPSANKMDEATAWKKLVGDWRPVTMKFAGQDIPDEVRASVTLTITEKKYTSKVNDQIDAGELKLDLSGELMGLDLKGTEGPNKDKLIPAIFKFDDGKLHVCYELDGTQRPAKFESPENTSLALIVFERIPKKESEQTGSAK